MRALGTFLVVVAAGIVTYTIVFPAIIIAGLVVLVLGLIAAIGFIGALLSLIGWFVLGDPAALSAALKCAVMGCIGFLPSFIGGYYLSGAWVSLTARRQMPVLDAPFIEPAQRSLSTRDG